MHSLEKWIWLPKDQYPNNQTTVYSPYDEHTAGNYTVAEFEKEYDFGKVIRSAKLRFSGDTEFQLFCNGEVLATGPIAVGGDFLENDRPRDNFYASEVEITPNSRKLCFFARVKMMPVIICEYSKGHGGLMLTGHITFEDGTKTVITTDQTWKVRKNGAYTAPSQYDSRIEPDAYVNAEVTDNIWQAMTAPIPVREEKELFPLTVNVIQVAPNEERQVTLEFDMIHAGFVKLAAKTEGPLFVEVHCRELTEEGSHESVVFGKDGEYRSFALHSVGNYVLSVKNESGADAELTVSLIATHYPVDHVSKSTTDDKELNTVLDVCRHTLKYCRQTHHLDSPRHCEPLACTGDYYIESLMTAFSFGDMRLAEFDIIRTAELLRNNDGRMFHTTYSLIWVMMLYDVYQYTGNKELLEDCEDALMFLLRRFETYIGDNQLIDNPPDYMFVDWIYIDEISMHHPVKALGQTCLNMFYYGALDAAARVYTALSEDAMAKDCLDKKEVLGKAINTLLYDEEKGMFFEGLNTPTPEEKFYKYLSQNVEKRYYLKHSNILAAYVGVCEPEKCKELLHRIMSDEIPGEYQPYFAHFLLEAIYRNGLRDEYTLKVIDKWKAPIAECDRGLVEGVLPPEPTYSFDHSHAWGGSPLYSLPMAVMGLNIVEPGLKALELSPSLLGLAEAKVELPTPYGDVVLELKAGEEPKVSHPEEVTVTLK